MDSQRESLLPSWPSSVVIRRDPVAWATVKASHPLRTDMSGLPLRAYAEASRAR
jgi:hypothetical protein